MPAPEPENTEILRQVRAWLQQARQVTVLTGAGVSAESGVPTFRDVQTGIWAQFDPQEMASEPGFRAHPQRVWQWYAHRRNLVSAVQPNAAHRALAQFACHHPGKLQLVTQNVDGLHQRAGSPEVIALHGDLLANQWLDAVCPQCDLEAAVQRGGEPPSCPTCGNPVRPGVVWFGEHLPAAALAQAEAAVQTCDLMLVVGTSGVVYPAAGLVFQAHQHGARVVVVSPDATELVRLADACVRATAAQALPQLLRLDEGGV